MAKSKKIFSRRDLHAKRVAILTAGPSGNAMGGAERFYSGLHRGFKELGCCAELIAIEADEPDFDTILSNYRKFRELDLSSYDLVVSTKVPTYAVNHHNHVLYLVHTVRVFDDMFEDAFTPLSHTHYAQRAKLHSLDFEAISGPKARFVIGHEVARRLYRWRGFSSQVLHPPLGFNGFKAGVQGDYFFLPGRLHPWKRIDLIIEAVRLSNLPIRLVLAGVGEAEQHLKSLANGDQRVIFLGRVDDERLIQLYADCLAVPFVPKREDYGFVTLEAFASGKPVLTCFDSGEPCFFVRSFETGLVVKPTPSDIQKGLDWIWHNKEKAASMGAQAQREISGTSWAETAFELAAAAFEQKEPNRKNFNHIAVIDMQPIDPPIGGGRLRLLGLYHNLGAETDCIYVGTYDWPGELYRSHMLSKSMREINVPLSDAHHAAAVELARQTGGKVLIDLAFSSQGHLSPQYLSAVQEQIAEASVVVFSHPWVYPLVSDRVRAQQVLIYDSQNVEGYLRAQLLDESIPIELDLLHSVIQDENDLGWAADWILACSHEDLLRFHRVYGFPCEKMRVVPNGVMAFSHPPPSPDFHISARRDLGLDASAFIAIFLGSPYGPNVQAANFIVHQLAPAMPNVTFVIAGGVGESVQTSTPNLRITGLLDEANKARWLYASDIAVNPMMSGSGTNIKMFDFMAMGLPVVTTEIGARGIDAGGRHFMLVAEQTPKAFESSILRLQDADLRRSMGNDARLCVEDGYAWERISGQLGCFIAARERLAGQSKPLFSIVVPTYERHDQLCELISCLQNQIERDFEVVLVDQSAEFWAGADKNYGFPLTYYHSPVKGAVRARNTGAMLAQGNILAFVDDDCLPHEDWLVNARVYFDDDETVGVEGLIYSDHLDDPDFRPVSNVNQEGIGFRTANFLVRSGSFQYAGGFDLQFDRPHFREDTDFGWRLLEIGKVPYGKDVKVFHPAQHRSKERESAEERVKFFQKDALLYRKNPEKYRQLFMMERHFSETPGFIENLIAGFNVNKVDIPFWVIQSINEKNE